MKVLIVCSSTSGKISPFIIEQVESLKLIGVDFAFHLTKRKGALGYLKSFFALRARIKKEAYDIIHAHYGMSGFISSLQNRIPVIITFHGSDVNDEGINLILSKIAERNSKHSIFVNQSLADKLQPINKYSVISCGVDLNIFYSIQKSDARKYLKLDQQKKYFLFSSSFDNPVKNYLLAKKAIQLSKNVTLIELKNYTRIETNYLMNACDGLLITSFNESGPLVAKEAIACGCPVVSVNVGDVKSLLNGIEGCYITSYDSKEIAEKINQVITNKKRINARQQILNLELDSNIVANKVLDIYKKIHKDKSNVRDLGNN